MDTNLMADLAEVQDYFRKKARSAPQVARGYLESVRPRKPDIRFTRRADAVEEAMKILKGNK